MSEHVPRLENCGRYLACNNKGQWFYINHGGTWQTFQGFDAANALSYKARADNAEGLLANCAKRLHAAIIASGSDEEFADIAVQEYRAFLAKPQDAKDA